MNQLTSSPPVTRTRAPAVQVPPWQGHLTGLRAVQADGQRPGAGVQTGDEGAAAVGNAKLTEGVVAAHHPVAHGQLAVLDAEALGTEAAVRGQDLLAVAVEPVHLIPPGGEDHHVLGGVLLGFPVRGPPVVQQRQGQLLLGLRGDDPVVRLVDADRLVDLALAHELDRLALPGVQLPAVLHQLARAQPQAQGAEAAAGVDRRKLPVIPHQDHLGAVSLGVLEEASELP